MLKRNQLYVSLFASSLVLLGSSVANAQQNLTSSASVTVQNAFDLNEITPLSFGSIRATWLSVGASTIELRPDGSSDATNLAVGSGPQIATLIPGQPAEFGIANASSFTPMTIVLPTSVNLINTQAPSTTARFTLGSFTFADSLTPSTVLSSGSATQTVTTSNTGTASFLVGATLSTAPGLPDAAGTTGYLDGAYEGNFTVTVRY